MSEEAVIAASGLDRARIAARDWWSARSRREQALIAIFGGLLLLWIVTGLVVRPLLSARIAAEQRVRLYEGLTDRLRAAGTIRSTPAAQLSGSPTTILSASAGPYALMPVVTPTPDGQFRVVVAGAPYEALLHWIADVEQRSRLRIVTMRIDRTATPGLVAAELQVRG